MGNGGTERPKGDRKDCTEAIYKAKPIAFCLFAFNLEHVLLTTAHTCTPIAAHSRLLSSLHIDIYVLYVAPPPVISQNFDFISHLLH